MATPHSSEIAPGTLLVQYEIVAPLGEGGMGKIYLAQDTRLGRKVALKLLPAEFLADEDFLARFRQEARAASALNHPNIVTVYDIGQEGATPFLATEFIEGQTLRGYKAQQSVPLLQVLDIAQQIAGALAAAHEIGIVHRDIKPDNIMVRPDGYIKVLDFGVAKLTEKLPTEQTLSTDSKEPTLAKINTDPGTIMGTVTYMSPEQARGVKVDARTDIFSLGVVLYELITGRVPFTGETSTDVIIAIVEREPSPLTTYRPDVPAELQRIVSQALQKDRAARYQTAAALAQDLKNLKLALESAASLGYTQAALSQAETSQRSSAPTSLGVGRAPSPLTAPVEIFRFTEGLKHLSTRITRGRQALIAVPIILTLVTALAVWQLAGQYWSTTNVSAPFDSMRLTKLTTTGRATRAAISPDGKYVVYAMTEQGKQGLWVGQVATTNSVSIVPPADVVYRGLTFSHDGNFVYYIVQEGNNPIQVLYQVPALGGSARKLLVDLDSPVTLAPDGRQLAFIRRNRQQGEDYLVIAKTDGSDEQRLATRKAPDFFSVNGPAWSPDGKIIACAGGSAAGGRRMNVLEIRVTDGSQRAIGSQQWFDAGRVAWQADGRKLIVNATEQGTTMAQLWSLTYPDGKAQRVTNDLNDYRELNLTTDAQTLVTVQSESCVNIWLAPNGDSNRAAQITSGVGQYNGVRGIAWTPDGRLVYISRVSSSQDVWIMDRDGRNQKQLTTVETRADVYPSVSADGRYIVFTSNRTGNSNLWRMELDGGQPTRLTEGAGEEFAHASPASPWVVYNSTSSSRFTLWKVSLEGGRPVQVTDKLSQWPAVSPDGRWIACWYRGEIDLPWRLAVLPFDGGEPAKIFEVATTATPALPVRWTADGRALTYADTRDGISNLWLQPLDGGLPRQLTNFKAEQIFWFDWSRDGKQLAVSRGAVTSDVVLISNFN